MVGLFGYFSSKPDHDKILSLAKNLQYSVKESKASDNTLVLNLGIKSKSTDDVTVNFEKMNFVVFCGEIFNEDIIDPKKYFLDLYENGNLNEIKKLNGSFLAAIYDKKNEKLTIINDRFGSKKLFYYSDKNNFYFSPKIVPLLQLVKNKKIRRDALYDFFVFGYFLGDKTFDENIFQLLPASVIEITKNNIAIKKYWTIDLDVKYDLRDKDILIDELEKRWQRAINNRIKKNRNIIIEISGGLDSRAILAAALKSTSKENIMLYNYGDKKSYDFNFGSYIAKTLGIHCMSLPAKKDNFEEQYIKSFHDVEGMIDATPYCAIEMDEYLNGFSKKIYNGYLGGEIMGPLIFSKIDKLKLNSDTEYKKAKDILLNHHKMNDIQTIKNLFNSLYIKDLDILSSFEESVHDIKNISSEEFPQYCARWLYTNESPKYTSYCNFRYDNLFYYYKPFLDNEIVDFMLNVPIKMRRNKKLYRLMLIKKYPDLFNLPTKINHGLPLHTSPIQLSIKRVLWFIQLKINKISNYIVKHNLFFNRYQNYIDYNDLLRTNKEYQVFIRTMIEKIKKREFFNAGFIDTLWNLHLNGKKNYVMIFGLLVTLELILENYYDSN